MKKSLSRRNLDAEGQRDVDLRDKLSRNAQASSRSDSRQHVTESSASGLGRRIPSTRSADDLLELDSHRKSYSWTSDRQRLGSPDRFISTQRHISPSRRYEELRHASAITSIDASRPSSFLTNSGIGDASRSLNFMAKDINVGAKPVVRAPAPGIIGPRSVLKVISLAPTHCSSFL
ncbi:hypothetical protein B296_00046373 [Ensete ventricosum]|uniref:Uncharacterized protein n=1 Tax=Ensete ventricosum TaxID=4639 RepID=A0A426Z439_ENSVE|nr:hypothetical protein B296_00046373 [Ensete ventricosum]